MLSARFLTFPAFARYCTDVTEELGARLLQAGLTTEATLAHARAEGIEGHAVSGGGLLARLHDEGLAEEDLVGLFASEGHGAALDAEDLAVADPDLVHQLPGDRAHALVALPMLANASRVFVAMADPTDAAAREELAQTFGTDIEPLLARIGALRAALQAAHPECAPVAEVPVELVRRRESQPAAPPTPPGGRSSLISRSEASWSSPGTESAPTAGRSMPSWTPLGSGARRLPDEGDAPRPGPLPDIGPAIAALRQSGSRDEIVHLGCEATLSVARGAVLLAVRPEVLRGWHGLGAHVSLDAVRNLWIPRQSPSVFRDVAQLGEPYAGPYGDAAADALYRAAAGAQGGHCAIRPVRVSGRTVALLVADAPAYGEAGLERIGTVAQVLGEQLLRLLAQARHGT